MCTYMSDKSILKYLHIQVGLLFGGVTKLIILRHSHLYAKESIELFDCAVENGWLEKGCILLRVVESFVSDIVCL